MKKSFLALAVTLGMPVFVAIAQPANDPAGADNSAPPPPPHVAAMPELPPPPAAPDAPRHGRGSDAQRPPLHRMEHKDLAGAPGQSPEHRPVPPAIIAALDANHDGVIDSNEIAKAVEVLKALDRNNDGKLTPDEFIGLRHQRGPGGPEARAEDNRGPKHLAMRDGAPRHELRDGPAPRHDRPAQGPANGPARRGHQPPPPAAPADPAPAAPEPPQNSDEK